MATKVNLKPKRKTSKKQNLYNKKLYISLAVLACLAAMGVASLSMAAGEAKKSPSAAVMPLPMYRVKCVIDEHTAKGGVGIRTHAYFKGEMILKKQFYSINNFFELKKARTTGVVVAGVSQIADRLYVSADKQMDYLQLDLHVGEPGTAQSSIIRSSSDFAGMANLVFEQEKNGDKVVLSATCKIAGSVAAPQVAKTKEVELPLPKSHSSKGESSQSKQKSQERSQPNEPEDVLPPRPE